MRSRSRGMQVPRSVFSREADFIFFFFFFFLPHPPPPTNHVPPAPHIIAAVWLLLGRPFPAAPGHGLQRDTRLCTLHRVRPVLEGPLPVDELFETDGEPLGYPSKQSRDASFTQISRFRHFFPFSSYCTRMIPFSLSFRFPVARSVIFPAVSVNG